MFDIEAKAENNNSVSSDEEENVLDDEGSISSFIDDDCSSSGEESKNNNVESDNDNESHENENIIKKNKRKWNADDIIQSKKKIRNQKHVVNILILIPINLIKQENQRFTGVKMVTSSMVMMKNLNHFQNQK